MGKHMLLCKNKRNPTQFCLFLVISTMNSGEEVFLVDWSIVHACYNVYNAFNAMNDSSCFRYRKLLFALNSLAIKHIFYGVFLFSIQIYAWVNIMPQIPFVFSYYFRGGNTNACHTDHQSKTQNNFK